MAGPGVFAGPTSEDHSCDISTHHALTWDLLFQKGSSVVTPPNGPHLRTVACCAHRRRTAGQCRSDTRCQRAELRVRRRRRYLRRSILLPVFIAHMNIRRSQQSVHVIDRDVLICL